jgi:hypothetical protein
MATYSEQIACVRREIAMRERSYPRWVEAGKMTQEKAEDELAAMRAVLATIIKVERAAAALGIRV